MGARSILAFHYSSCDRFAAGDLVRSADRPRIHLAVQAIARLERRLRHDVARFSA